MPAAALSAGFDEEGESSSSELLDGPLPVELELGESDEPGESDDESSEGLCVAEAVQVPLDLAKWISEPLT